MSIKILVYGIMLLISVFAVSGMNVNSLFKTNHVWEARTFTALLILGLTYLSGTLIIEVINVFSNL